MSAQDPTCALGEDCALLPPNPKVDLYFHTHASLMLLRDKNYVASVCYHLLTPCLVHSPQSELCLGDSVAHIELCGHVCLCGTPHAYSAWQCTENGPLPGATVERTASRGNTSGNIDRVNVLQTSTSSLCFAINKRNTRWFSFDLASLSKPDNILREKNNLHLTCVRCCCWYA